MNTKANKYAIVAALQKWIAQSPRLQFANYGCRKAYASEQRAILRDRRDAECMLSAVQCIADISGEDLAASFNAYSGRLSWDGQSLDYVTGQYWPTEYRKAACAVLAKALWDHFRKDPDCKTGDDVRKALKGYLRNAGLCKRWFN